MNYRFIIEINNSEETSKLIKSATNKVFSNEGIDTDLSKDEMINSLLFSSNIKSNDIKTFITFINILVLLKSEIKNIYLVLDKKHLKVSKILENFILFISENNSLKSIFSNFYPWLQLDEIENYKKFSKICKVLVSKKYNSKTIDEIFSIIDNKYDFYFFIFVLYKNDFFTKNENNSINLFINRSEERPCRERVSFIV